MTLRLLLIDDHPLFRSGIGMVLAAGFKNVEVSEAASIEQALLCPHDELDLLLIDVQLQGLNGLDGIALLKRKWPLAKVLVVSASQEEQTAREAMARGASGFISKTQTPERMLQQVAAVLASDVTTNPEPAPGQDKAIRLTPRQYEVLEHVCQGLSNKMIGRRLNLSEHTVRGHVQATLQVLRVSSRSEAAFVARRMGLVN